MHRRHRRHRRFISFVPIVSKSFLALIDYYSSRSTKLIWQQNVFCMLKAVRERETYFHRRHRRFISFVPIVSISLFVSYIDYYSSRSTELIWQQNVLCMLKTGRERTVDVFFFLSTSPPLADAHIPPHHYYQQQQHYHGHHHHLHHMRCSLHRTNRHFLTTED